ncbi:hypothetical protein FRB95_006354 [Tulasnella sp. JGI-2019a]|nr:hypothetical protein FRB95_006354 [Tulasnella sp. JGI-2019a]
MLPTLSEATRWYKRRPRHTSFQTILAVYCVWRGTCSEAGKLRVRLALTDIPGSPPLTPIPLLGRGTTMADKPLSRRHIGSNCAHSFCDPPPISVRDFPEDDLKAPLLSVLPGVTGFT